MRAACCEATVLRHEVIADDIRLLTALWPDREHAPHAGQFFTLRAWGADEAPFLSRPISVHKWDAETQTVEFLYAVVGEGTRKLTALKKGDSFQLTGPMGNGFDVADILSKYQKIAVVGGGIGTAPMYQLTRELAAGGVKPDVFFGFRDKPYCMASVGQAFMHIPQRIHSAWLGVLVMSTSILQAFAQAPQETHLWVSTRIWNSETLFSSA